MVEGRRRFIVACIVNPMRLVESLVTEKPSESMELVKSKSVSLAFYRYGVGLVGKYAAIPGSGSAREREARRSHSATYVRVRYQRWPGPLGGFAARGKIRPAIRTGGVCHFTAGTAPLHQLNHVLLLAASWLSRSLPGLPQQDGPRFHWGKLMFAGSTTTRTGPCRIMSYH